MVRFIAFSDSNMQIEEFKDYIQELYGRNETDGSCGSRLSGGDMEISLSNGHYMLSGSHSGGSVYNLMFHAAIDDMEEVLKGIIYAESDGTDILAYVLYPGTPDSESEAKDGYENVPDGCRMIDLLDDHLPQDLCPAEIRSEICRRMLEG